MSEQAIFENCLDSLLKTSSDLKREEFLRRQKLKKIEKKKNKKKNKNTSGNDYDNNNKNNNSSAANSFYNGNSSSEFPSLIKNGNGLNYNTNTTYISEYEQKRLKELEELSKLLKEENMEIEYIDEDPNTKGKFYNDFKSVFEYFVIPKKEKKENDSDADEDEFDENNYYNNDYLNLNENSGMDQLNSEFNNTNNPLEENIKRLSKKKRKLLSRMKISELKQKTHHPEVVEAWDVTSHDPCLLVYLKSLKNTIQVPKHWSQKRKFLQNKRGVLKPPFQLPEFIEATGISKIRDNIANDRKSLKTKARERMQPKLGKLDIDYQILHDAFFKHQTKSNLTIHGDIYYENKEYENKMKIYKPGRISEKLRVALGIPENCPPPWIINMQRYGPPPAYPNLKIPGVNAPVADPTAEITPNLWTPPTHEEKPVFIYDYKKKEGEIERWGDLRELEEEEYSDLDEDLSISDKDNLEDNIRNEGKASGATGENLFAGFDINDIDGTGKAGNGAAQATSNAAAAAANLASNLKQLPADGAKNIDLSGAIPYVPGINTMAKNTEEDQDKFYTILEQKATNIKKGEIFGSTHGYVMPSKNEEKKDSDKNAPKKK